MCGARLACAAAVVRRQASPKHCLLKSLSVSCVYNSSHSAQGQGGGAAIEASGGIIWLASLADVHCRQLHRSKVHSSVPLQQLPAVKRLPLLPLPALLRCACRCPVAAGAAAAAALAVTRIEDSSMQLGGSLVLRQQQAGG